MSWIENWPELAAIGLILGGALLAISSQHIIMTLLICIAAGGIMARFTTLWPEEPTKMHLMTLATLIGILLGTDKTIIPHSIISYAIGYAISRNTLPNPQH